MQMSARIIKGKASVMACHAITFENDYFQQSSARDGFRADEELSAPAKCGGRLASECRPKKFGGVLQQCGDEPADGRASDGDRL